MRRSARSWRSCTGKRIKRFTGQPTALQGTARMPRMPSKTCKTDPGPPSSDFKKDPEGYLCRAGINEARSIGRRQERQKLADVDVDDLDIPLTAAIWGGDGDTEHLEDLDRRLRLARDRYRKDLSPNASRHLHESQAGAAGAGETDVHSRRNTMRKRKKMSMDEILTKYWPSPSQQGSRS